MDLIKKQISPFIFSKFNDIEFRELVTIEKGITPELWFSIYNDLNSSIPVGTFIFATRSIFIDVDNNTHTYFISSSMSQFPDIEKQFRLVDGTLTNEETTAKQNEDMLRQTELDNTTLKAKNNMLLTTLTNLLHPPTTEVGLQVYPEQYEFLYPSMTEIELGIYDGKPPYIAEALDDATKTTVSASVRVGVGEHKLNVTLNQNPKRGTYFVRVVDKEGTTEIVPIIINYEAIPVLKSPMNVTIQAKDTKFTWIPGTSIGDVIPNNHFQLSTDSTFSNVDVDIPNITTSFITKPLELGKRYYWRVGNPHNNDELFSNSASFATDDYLIPEVSRLIIPNPDSIIPGDAKVRTTTPIEFVWSVAPNVTAYRLSVNKYNSVTNTYTTVYQSPVLGAKSYITNSTAYWSVMNPIGNPEPFVSYQQIISDTDYGASQKNDYTTFSWSVDSVVDSPDGKHYFSSATSSFMTDNYTYFYMLGAGGRDESRFYFKHPNINSQSYAVATFGGNVGASTYPYIDITPITDSTNSYVRAYAMPGQYELSFNLEFMKKLVTERKTGNFEFMIKDNKNRTKKLITVYVT